MTTVGEVRTEVPASALLRAVLDATAEAVVLCRTADDQILLVNAAAGRLLPGLDLGELAARGDTFAAEWAGRHVVGRRRPIDDDHYAWYLRDRTEEVERATSLATERARAAFLAEAGRRLAGSLHGGRCQRAATELAVAHLADAAVVLLPAENRRSVWTRLVTGGAVEEGRTAEGRLGEVPGLVEALGGFPPIPSRWLDAAQAPGWLLPPGFGPIGALLVTPLPGNAGPAGALVLARRGPDATFGPEDEMVARTFAARAGAALAVAALYRAQADTAAVLQADLLPPEMPPIEGFELAAAYQTAGGALRVGGDFYEVHGPTETATDTLIALGDVCGTGAEAAVLTGKVRHTLRTLRVLGVPAAAMLPVLNRALLHAGRSQRFVTMVVGSVRRAEHGRVRLTLASGGHPAPLVLRSGGTVEEVPTRGTLIGAVAQTVVVPAETELAPGDLCLLFSDGLIEARGGPAGDEPYGEDRLHAALASCAGLPAAVTVERLRQLVSDWAYEGVQDDVALLAVRAPSRPSLTLRDGDRGSSPYAIDARRRPRQRT